KDGARKSAPANSRPSSGRCRSRRRKPVWVAPGTSPETAKVDNCLDLPQVMHVLPEHFGGDQRHAAVGDEETLAVLRRIDTGFEPYRKRAIPVDDALPEHDIAMHLDVGQDHRVLDVAIAV